MSTVYICMILEVRYFAFPFYFFIRVRRRTFQYSLSEIVAVFFRKNNKNELMNSV